MLARIVSVERRMEKGVTLILCNNSVSKHTDINPPKYFTSAVQIGTRLRWLKVKFKRLFVHLQADGPTLPTCPIFTFYFSESALKKGYYFLLHYFGFKKKQQLSKVGAVSHALGCVSVCSINVL